jgi:hypothetical protein
MMLAGRYSRRRFGVAIGIALIGAVAILWSRVPSLFVSSAKSVAPGADVERPPPPAAHANPADAKRDAEPGGIPIVDSPEPDASDRGKDDPRSVVPIDGTVLYVDRDGREHDDADGEFSYIVHGTDPPDPVHFLSVARGRFHVDVPRETQFDLEMATFEGHSAWFDGVNPSIWWGSESPIVVHVKAGHPFRARFIDAESGVELEHVSVVVESDEPCTDDTLERIPAGRLLLRDAASPIELEARMDPEGVHWHRDLRAIAPGHAWTSIRADFQYGGQILVPMHRGGSLRVTVLDAPADAMLSVNDPLELPAELSAYFASRGADFFGNRVEFAEVKSSAPIVFEAIPVGKYVISVDLGSDPFTVALAHEPVGVVPDKTTELVLRCRTLSHEPRVSVAGTVMVPRAWGNGDFTLSIAPLRRPDLDGESHDIPSSAMRCEDGDPRVFHWSVPGVEPADYSFSVDRFGIQRTCTIGADGLHNLDLVAGSCGEVVIHVLDASTGMPLDWYYPGDTNGASVPSWRTGDESSSASFQLELDRSRNVLVGRVALGPGRLEEFVGADFVDCEVVETGPFAIHAGCNELTLHVRRNIVFKIALELSVDGWRLPWPDLKPFNVVPVDHDGECVDQPWGGEDDHILEVSRPGRYRVTIQAIPGFEPVPPFEVEASDVESVHHKIELHRKQ